MAPCFCQVYNRANFDHLGYRQVRDSSDGCDVPNDYGLLYRLVH